MVIFRYRWGKRSRTPFGGLGLTSQTFILSFDLSFTFLIKDFLYLHFMFVLLILFLLLSFKFVLCTLLSFIMILYQFHACVRLSFIFIHRTIFLLYAIRFYQISIVNLLSIIHSVVVCLCSFYRIPTFLFQFIIFMFP